MPIRMNESLHGGSAGCIPETIAQLVLASGRIFLRKQQVF